MMYVEDNTGQRACTLLVYMMEPLQCTKPALISVLPAASDVRACGFGVYSGNEVRPFSNF